MRPKPFFVHMKSLVGCVHLSLDGWTSDNGNSFQGIILHRINQNKKDNPLVILTLALDLASAIAASVEQVAEEYGIVNRTWAMILDNCSTNTAMRAWKVVSRLQAAFTLFKTQKEKLDNFGQEEKNNKDCAPGSASALVGEDEGLNFDSPLADSDKEDGTPYESLYMLDKGEQDCLDDQVFLESIVDVEATDQVDDNHAQYAVVLPV
ncbi:hypothetical protein PROFUN_15727 [Planoprotostelium fungivorum]|uniref:DUF659 domain-containing protein n=1 Tax=Planoprotostelium fungivorum TaxID=1890364 RepID=A0A2P6MUJ5_9EUKA|nr:hypothetical protein PROFUN_15727 [Planoprotostelium fungivorum]